MFSLPKDANGYLVQALLPMDWQNIATTEHYQNDSDECQIVRVVATDADATLIIAKTLVTSGDWVFLPQSTPEYLHLPIGYYVYVSGATVNLSVCQ